MAEVTGLRNNALPYPVYGAPWAIVLPILDADGDLVTGAASLDSEISKNGDTPADCTNEATEIGSSGKYYLILTGTELTADIVDGVTKTGTAGAKNTPWTLYPRKLVTLHSGTAAGGAAGSITLDSGASAIDDFYNGCLVVATLDGAVECRIVSDYVGSTKVASVVPDWNTTPDSDDTFIVKLTEGIQINQANVTLIEGVDATDQIRDAVVDDATRIDASALNTATGTTIPAILDDTDLIDDGTSGLAKIATDVAAILVDTGTTLQGELDGIQADTEDIQARLPAALVGGRIDATVDATGLEAGALALINTEVDTALTDIHLDHLLAVTYDPASQPGAADALLNELIESDAGVSRFTANALEEAPTGGSAPTVAEIADGVWDEATSGHTTSGTFGEQLKTDVDAILADTTTLLSRITSSLFTGITSLAQWLGLIAGKQTGNSTARTEVRATGAGSGTYDETTDSQEALRDRGDAAWTTATGFSTHSAADVWAAGTRTLTAIDEDSTTLDLDATVRSAVGMASANLDTQLGDLPTNAELTAAFGTADDAVLAAIAALNNLSQANIRTAVGLGSANLDTQLAAIAGYLDTEIAAILASVDTEIGAIKAVTDLLNSAQAEPSSIPAANATPLAKLALLYVLARNKSTLATDGSFALRNDGDTADIGTRTDNDDGTTYTRGKVA